MSKKILIVESDTALSATLRRALEARGFSVDETTDGKGSVEQVRRDRPELVVLAVELGAGQNGYLICGKLKKDDDLKGVPIIITGNPDGFAQHRKLKAHADDYVSRPVDADLLVERVGALIGFPPAPEGEAELVEDGLDLPGLDEPLSADGLGDFGGEEISVESGDAAAPAAAGDTELDMLDAAFDDISTTVDTTELENHLDGGLAGSALEIDAGEEPVVAPPEGAMEEVDSLPPLESVAGTDDDGALDVFEEELHAEPPAAPPPAPVAERPAPAPLRAVAAPLAAASLGASLPRTGAPAAGLSAADAAELRSLRARVVELQGALEDAQAQAGSAEERSRALEADLEARSAELETARASSGRSDKDTFALREAANRKDKEILRLKAELNEKEHELVELRDRQLQLEQQGNDATAEVAKRDAQIKTLTGKADLLTAERRRVDQQLVAAREEARAATGKLAALQAELDGFHAQHESSQAELEGLRSRGAELEAAVASAQSERDSLRDELEVARAEASDVQAQLADAQAQLAEARGEVNALAASAAEEADGLRLRIAELEESHVRHEDRVAKLYARIKADEATRERAKKALGIAQQLLEEQPAGIDADEEAAA
ncbi:response regulator [Aggregicoccus sp. 17bor-14]|uniref:response regulator n=1 Tax=Myxococcaceae TaxID=31 RepID=UPI00129CA4FE|nr:MULTISPECIES: response regulator [Myxococcaceae]MBF5044110.1 response regulator [Simulacricoccus sp. 17bor-14]MRI89860.1 response regulator [Aggregicoccus sp. 17bor-14]